MTVKCGSFEYYIKYYADGLSWRSVMGSQYAEDEEPSAQVTNYLAVSGGRRRLTPNPISAGQSCRRPHGSVMSATRPIIYRICQDPGPPMAVSGTRGWPLALFLAGFR